MVIWNTIKQFFGNLFEGIGNFFKKLLGREEPAPASAVAPVVHATADSAIEKLEKRVPLADEKAKQNIAGIVAEANSPGYLGHEFAPEKLHEHLAYSNVSPVDPSIGTASNPILQQAQDGRLIVNVPENANIVISRQDPGTVLPGDKPMAVMTVMPSWADLGKFVRRAYDLDHPGEEKPQESGSFKGRSYLIPEDMVQKGQIVFKTPRTGKNSIVMAEKLDKPATIFVVESKGAKLETRGIDALVNKEIQLAQPRLHLPNVDEEALAMIRFNNEYERDVADRTARQAAKEKRGASVAMTTENKDQPETSKPKKEEPPIKWEPMNASFGHWNARRHSRYGQLISKADEADPTDSKSPTSGLPTLMDDTSKNKLT